MSSCRAQSSSSSHYTLSYEDANKFCARNKFALDKNTKNEHKNGHYILKIILKNVYMCSVTGQSSQNVTQQRARKCNNIVLRSSGMRHGVVRRARSASIFSRIYTGVCFKTSVPTHNATIFLNSPEQNIAFFSVLEKSNVMHGRDIKKNIRINKLFQWIARFCILKTMLLSTGKF